MQHQFLACFRHFFFILYSFFFEEKKLLFNFIIGPSPRGAAMAVPNEFTMTSCMMVGRTVLSVKKEHVIFVSIAKYIEKNVLPPGPSRLQ